MNTMPADPLPAVLVMAQFLPLVLQISVMQAPPLPALLMFSAEPWLILPFALVTPLRSTALSSKPAEASPTAMPQPALTAKVIRWPLNDWLSLPVIPPGASNVADAMCPWVAWH